MSKKKHVKMKEMEPVILSMREEGKRLRGISRELGLEEKRIHFCSHEHIQNKTGVTPLSLRHST